MHPAVDLKMPTRQILARTDGEDHAASPPSLDKIGISCGSVAEAPRR
jgi:hypothetical protein